MPKMYAVQGQIETEREGWTGSRQLPTFYLHPSVQGITSTEHAERIARDLLTPFMVQEGADRLHLSVGLVQVTL